MERAGVDGQVKVSVIVPVLNEAGIIRDALSALSRLRGDYEVIIVDGGSSDETWQLVSETISLVPAYRLISSPVGRGNQLNAGVAVARGQAFLFLHADSLLSESAIQSIEHALEQPEIVGGNFRLEFEGSEFSSAIFTRLNSIRRWFGIYYGDSAIWARREIFERIGGFTAGSLMEDYELCRRLERSGRTVCLTEPVVTSARRWRDHGVIKTLIIWILIQWLYLFGVSPVCLARLYYPRRSRVLSLDSRVSSLKS